jgi:hypothetical protein
MNKIDLHFLQRGCMDATMSPLPSGILQGFITGVPLILGTLGFICSRKRKWPSTGYVFLIPWVLIRYKTLLDVAVGTKRGVTHRWVK